MLVFRTFALALASVAVASRPLIANDTLAPSERAYSSFADLLDDQGLKSAIQLLETNTLVLRNSPNDMSLQGVYLASRQLKSQLSRYNEYLGNGATKSIESGLLPILDSTSTAVRTNRELPQSRVNLTLSNLEMCRQILHGGPKR